LEELMANGGYDFQEIHDTFRPKLIRYLTRLAGEGEAEDLCQEVFTKINKALAGLRAEASLASWVYRIATNTFYDRVRSRSYRQSQAETLTSTEEFDAFSEQTPGVEGVPASIENQVIRSEMIDCVRSYIDQLPEDYRIVLLLSEEEGFKVREIAEILQLSLDNAKVRLHRARAKLKESLKENCDFYLDERSEIACDRKQGCD
jgi:RNA polymerase sigma-70 factor (ECF subfamily)